MTNTTDSLPRGWRLATLSELVADDGVLTDGDWVESVDQDPNGEIRLTQLADVGDGRFRDRSDRYMTRAKALELRCTFLEKGDVLIARMPDPLGRACLFPGAQRPCVTVVDVCIVRPGAAPVHTPWLMHFINAPKFRAEVASLQAGSTRKRISKANLSTIALPVPPADEQREIAAALDSNFSRLDAATATLERVQRSLERYRASVLKAAVEGRLVPTEAELAKKEGRSYEPASVLLKRILAERRRRWEEAELAKLKAKGKTPTDDRWKARYVEPGAPDTEGLPELPEGWCWASVAQVALISGGITKNSKREKLPLQRPYLRVANVYANELRLDEIKHIGVSKDEAERTSMLPGDLLIVEGNGSVDQIGRVALWDGSIAGCVHQNHIIKMRLCDLRLARWSLTWLLSASGRKHIEGAASSTSGLHTLSLSKVASLPIPLAPSAEQSRVHLEVERLLSEQNHLQGMLRQACHRAGRLRLSILKWAFEGRLISQDAPDLSGVTG